MTIFYMYEFAQSEFSQNVFPMGKGRDGREWPSTRPCPISHTTLYLTYIPSPVVRLSVYEITNEIINSHNEHAKCN